MLRSVLHLSSALAVVCGAYFLYALIAVPMIEGSDVQRQQRVRKVEKTQASSVTDNSYLIKGLIPEDSWEHQGCKILVTTHGIVVFKEYTVTDKGLVAVKPFTLIANQDADRLAPGRRKSQLSDGQPDSTKASIPILLRSPEGAMLLFDNASANKNGDVTGFGFGKLVGGQLPGKVHISRGASGPLKDDSFEVVAHNVQIEGPMIMTPHDIAFRVGRTRGLGRNLTIHLQTDEASDPKSLAGVKSVRSLELAELKELLIETRASKLSDNGMFGQNSNDRVEIDSGDANYPATSAGSLHDDAGWTRVNVYCDGAFKLDFLKSIATFNQNVRVKRLNAGKASDSLECDHLAILFDKPFFEDPKSSAPQTTLVSNRPKSDSKSQPQLTKLIATGGSAASNEASATSDHRATLTLPSRSAVARAGSLEFDLIKKRVVLKDKLAVTLRDAQHEIVAPQLEYTLGEEGRLGVGWAPGPGRIEKFASFDTNGKQVDEGFVASWGMDMNIRPHEGKTTISLYERARIKVGENKEFDAGELHLWLWELPSNQNTSESAERKRWRLLPAQILATDNVTFATPQAFGKTQRVQCFWPDPVTTNSNAGNANAAIVASADANKKPNGLLVGAKDGKQPSKRWEVSTGQANIHLDAKSDLQLLELLDGADIREQSIPFSRDSLVIQGNSLIVAPVPAADQIAAGGEQTATQDLFNINVIGSPAIISGRKQSVYGNVITLDQLTNRVVVPGAGKMRIENPEESSKSQADSRFVDPLARSVPQQKTLTEVSWQKSLSFDGSIVILDGDAKVTTQRFNNNDELTTLDARAMKIKAVLEPAINFRKLDSSKSSNRSPSSETKPEVIELDLAGKVHIKSRTYNGPDKLKSIDHLMTDNLRIDPRGGDVASVGAGMVETVRIGKPGTETRFAGEVLPGEAPGLNYLQVNFAGGFSGNLFRKELTFRRKIRSLYGPVSNWAESLDINQQQSNPQVAKLDCEQLDIGQWRPDPKQKATIEMVAQGNVSIRGATFSSNSDRVSFMQSSNMLVIRGLPQKPAQLNYKSTPNGPQQYAEANEIKYWPERGQITVDQLEKAEYTTEEPTKPKGLPTLPGLKGFQVPGIRGR